MRRIAEMLDGGGKAQVAELVDALASGASVRKGVEVRVFSWAPNQINDYLAHCPKHNALPRWRNW